MAWSISDLFPPWGDSGERPADNFNYQGGDQVNEKHLDYLWYAVGQLEDEVRSALTDVDSDGDGVVDEADTANLYKGNDIDSDGDAVVDAADQLDNPAVHDVNQFSGANGASGQFVRSNGTDAEWVTPAFGSLLADGSGAVDTGDAANIYTTHLADGETLEVTEAALLQSDGEASPSGLNLVIATLDNAGNGTLQTTIISGDGSTVHDDETGSPLASYANTSGGGQTVMIAMDNGHFGTGSGSSADMFARAGVQVN